MRGANEDKPKELPVEQNTDTPVPTELRFNPYVRKLSASNQRT